MTMITRKEAYRLTLRPETTELALTKKISAAATAGKDDIYFSCQRHLENYVIEFLKGYDFSVSISDTNPKETTLYIYWGETKGR